MKLLKLKLNNFMLFSSAEIEPQSINLAVGINKDNPKDSSNGSGKSSLFKLAPIFLLYGDACGKKLNRLIRDGKKETIVEGEIEHLGNTYRIIRKVPNALQIFVNEGEKEFNTPTIGQHYLDSIFGNYEFFKKYCLVDNRGINVLNSLENIRSVMSFKQELMKFITNEFEPIRKSLLDDKNHRELYNKDKRLYSFFYSEKRVSILEKSLEKIKQEMIQIKQDSDISNKSIYKLKGDIQAIEKQIYYKNQDKKKLNDGICPILNTKCQSISEQSDKVNKEKTREIANLEADILIIKGKIKEEEPNLDYYNSLYADLQQQESKIKELIMKLKETQKFSEYKFTKEDVQLYTDIIKTLDNFSGYYIGEWMSNLSLVINDLLKNVNLSIKLTDEKEFIKIYDGEKELTYADLSSGQQTFLSAIFKLGILLQKGESDRIIIMDDGLGSLDEFNFKNLIEICQGLPFQFFIIFQDAPKIENINYYAIERKNGESKVK